MQRTPLANAPYGLFFSVFFLLSLCGCEPPAPDSEAEWGVEVKIDDRLAGMSLAELQKASVDAQVDHELAIIQANVNALFGPEILTEREQAEEFASRIANPFETVMLLLDLSHLYFILGKKEDASRCCDQAAGLTDSIAAPGNVATALLKLAEVSLVVCLANQDEQASAKLLQIRDVVIKAEKIIKEQLLASPTNVDAYVGETEGSQVAVQRSVTENYTQARQFLIDAMSRKELVNWTDELFAKIAKIQAWSSSLEEVGDTIHRITPGPTKDDALAVIIDMLIVSGPQDQIPSWLDMISEPATKENIRRKVEK